MQICCGCDCFIFSVWGWVTYNRESALPVTGELTDVILPGVSKAELILASGERIILGTQTEIRDIEELGVKITNDTSGGELKYETGSTEDSTITAYNTLIVPKGGEYMVRLPDGSQVWLNSETTIRFPVRFAAGKREVQLCGEAFLKCAEIQPLLFRYRLRMEKLRCWEPVSM